MYGFILLPMGRSAHFTKEGSSSIAYLYLTCRQPKARTQFRNHVVGARTCDQAPECRKTPDQWCLKDSLHKSKAHRDGFELRGNLQWRSIGLLLVSAAHRALQVFIHEKFPENCHILCLFVYVFVFYLSYLTFSRPCPQNLSVVVLSHP